MPQRLHERLANEVLAAQTLLEPVGETVTIFGGSRVKTGTPAYQAAREIGRLLSEEGISIMTGGGPGIMQAGNEGAQLGKKGKSIGLLITLPFEEAANPYLDIPIQFQHFASRKVTFCRYSEAVVFCEGGFGTLDELGEVLTLIATGKSPEIPLVMYDTAFWSGLMDWFRFSVLRKGLIDEKVLNDMIFVDHPQDVLPAIRRWQAAHPPREILPVSPAVDIIRPSFRESLMSVEGEGATPEAILANTSIKLIGKFDGAGQA